MKTLVKQIKEAKTEHLSLVLSLDLFASDEANAPTINKINSILDKIERLERTVAVREAAHSLRLTNQLISIYE